MIAAILLMISLVALAQFALHYWRAIVVGVASQPVSDRVLSIAGLAGKSVRSGDFATLLNLHGLTPALEEEGRGLRAVRAYYGVVRAFRRLFGTKLPALASWSDREMALCSRYVAVLVDHRLERNLACAAELRSS